MKAKNYSVAAIELLEQGMAIETVLDRIRTVLTSKGQMKLNPVFLRTLLRDLEAHYQKHRATVRVFSASDREAFVDVINSELTRLAIPAEAQTLEDTTIIGGYSITTTEQRIDKSYKRQLLEIYRAAIN